jgi:hypothetical protein
MRTILPSGSTTVLWDCRDGQPELPFISIQYLPLSVDRHVSFRKLGEKPPVVPPMITILPSGRTTLLGIIRAVQLAFAFSSVHVVPPSKDCQTSLIAFSLSGVPAMMTMLPFGKTTLV